MRSATAKAAEAAHSRSGVGWATGSGQEVRRPPPPRISSRVGPFPWDLAQDELGVPAADFLALAVRLLLVFVQDQIRAQLVDSS